MSVKIIDPFFSCIKFLSILLLSFSGYIQADCDCEQEQMPFLTNQQSPLLIGAGNIGAALPMRDAMGFYYNPAQLGYFSRDNSLSFFFMPRKTELMSYDYLKRNINSSGLAAGFNFHKADSSLPLSVGVGYIHSRTSYNYTTFENHEGTYSRIDYEDYEYFNSFSVGVSYNYYLLFNIGFAVKPYGIINNYDYSSSTLAEQKRTGTAFDFGAMITAPISDLLLKNKFSGAEGPVFRPKFDFTLGYSITNNGKKFSYSNPEYSYPIQRTARLGYTIDMGVDAVSPNDKKFNLIDYSFTAEAEDILVEYDYNTRAMEYQKLPGDIKVVKNLIQLKPDQYVGIHKGHIFRLAETAIIAIGREQHNSNYIRESNCYGVSTEGLFKLLVPKVTSPVTSYILNHVKLEYYYAEYKPAPSPIYRGLALYFKEIEL